MLSLLSAATSYSAPSTSCPPAGFAPLDGLNLTEYVRATWYIQQQQLTGYQPASALFCVTATYNLEGEKVPFSSDTVATVYNYANKDAVNGKLQNSGNSTLCARIEDPSNPAKLAVAPCFLPNFAAGPYWVMALGTDEDTGEYTWAIVIGGEPNVDYDDGCSTKESGINDAGLWLFTRQPVATAAQLDAMHAVLKAKGVAASKLHTVAQEGCNYEGAFIKK